MRLAVRVTPRGGRDAIEGWATDAAGHSILKIRVAAAATDGQANASVLALLAKTLGRPKSALTLRSGQASRMKLIDIDGLDDAGLAEALGAPPAPQARD